VYAKQRRGKSVSGQIALQKIHPFQEVSCSTQEVLDLHGDHEDILAQLTM
jgi:hypothetical protein